mmetsp:Transcript_10814/g.26985  ORF Transcript_10814/g.26985 Transcript_10814/m.26985 type:complete len:234 (-) Transcript_10814:226-927(-)
MQRRDARGDRRTGAHRSPTGRGAVGRRDSARHHCRLRSHRRAHATTRGHRHHRRRRVPGGRAGADDRAVGRHVEAAELLVQRVNVGSLLLVRGDECLEVRASLCFHVLADENGAGLPSAPLHLESRADDGDTDLGLVDIGHSVGVGLLELRHQLLRVPCGHARVSAGVQIEPLLEDARAVALCKAFNGYAEDSQATSCLGGEDRLGAFVHSQAQHCCDAYLHADGLRTSDDLC